MTQTPEWANDTALSPDDRIAQLLNNLRSANTKIRALEDRLFSQWVTNEIEGKNHGPLSRALLHRWFLRTTDEGLNQGACVGVSGDALTLQLFSWVDGSDTTMEAVSAQDALIGSRYTWYSTRYDFLVATYYRHHRKAYADTCGSLAEFLRDQGVTMRDHEAIGA